MRVARKSLPLVRWHRGASSLFDAAALGSALHAVIVGGAGSSVCGALIEPRVISREPVPVAALLCKSCRALVTQGNL